LEIPVDAPAFDRWIKRFTGGADATMVLFPHAGGAAAAYRPLAHALAGAGVDTFVVQYPQRAERLAHPAPATIEELARQLFDAGDWTSVAPLHLFGHGMGAVVAFEFARLAQRYDITIRRLWVSAQQAPSALAELPALPTTDEAVLADMVDLGGTDPRLLDDDDFVELLLRAVRADYRAMARYNCGPDNRITADISVLGGAADHRVSREHLQRWANHTTGTIDSTIFDGGHFYLTDHIDSIVELVRADGR